MENMTLFDFENNPEAVLEMARGFRLHKLEVLNWGTFDRDIWSLVPSGATTLLTGDVGSGKSTLVDALTTLLLSPKKVSYNKAADSGARERSISTYVRGVYGQKRSIEGGGKRTQSLRKSSHLSVILACFSDKTFNCHVTIVQYFWFTESGSSPVRAYVVADKALSIEKDFTNFNKDMRELKKRLKQTEGVKVFEDYRSYAKVFREKFGIEMENALDLFQQTISMKKVDALTDFVKTSMLEPPKIEDDVENLIKHFNDLNATHEAVLKAKDQIRTLTPLVEDGIQHRLIEAERTRLTEANKALPSWIAEQLLILLEAELRLRYQELEKITASLTQEQDALAKINRKIEDTKHHIRTNGGGDLETLEKNREDIEGQLSKILQNKTRYIENIERLKLEYPTSSDAFYLNKSALANLLLQEESRKEQLEKTMIDIGTEEKELQKKLTEVKKELSSLRGRKSSIPREFIDKRLRLCHDLDLTEKDLPFAGELMEVREDALEWEGAIERLVRSFGLSMLVPDRHYHRVAQWVNSTQLGLRLVYYRIPDTTARHPISKPQPDTVPYKLMVKQDSPFTSWVSKELFERFPYVCCKDMTIFSQFPKAISQTGQIKSSGGRHEKDDRHDIYNRRRYILGFSNAKKIATLEGDRKDLSQAIEILHGRESETKSQQKINGSQIRSIDDLYRVENFSEIDDATKNAEIAEIKQRIQDISENNEILGKLKDRLETLTKDHENKSVLIDKLKEKEINKERDIKDCNEKKIENIELANALPAIESELIYPVLDELKTKAMGDEPLTVKNKDTKEKKYGYWLAGKIEKLGKTLTQLSNSVVQKITQFNNRYPEYAKDMDANIASFPEYEEILEHLKSDGLPKFEHQFKQKLNENTINEIVLLGNTLKRGQDEIKDRIFQINQSLNSIDYNAGRYIRLEYNEAPDDDVKKFRDQLRECTEGSMDGQKDAQYTEKKFVQVKDLLNRFIGRPGESESDARWRKKVIDVRNWFEFSASERWRETDIEYEHYEDSSGKSGGQKEKLAYTILAASLVYNFGLEGNHNKLASFRFVVIDEAFLKSSDAAAKFGLELFRKLDLQLLIVTPLLKIPTIEPYIGHVGLVHYDDVNHISKLHNVTITEYKKGKDAWGKISNA